MRYCNKCKVSIRGNHLLCPLCQNETKKIKGSIEDTYPQLKTIYEQHNKLFHFLLFLSVIFSILSIAINFWLSPKVKWSIFVIIGIICAWLTMISAIHKRSNPARSIFYQSFLLSLLTLFWDFFTTWHGWSITYVLPTIYTIAIISLGVVAKISNLQIEDSMIYFLLDILFGIIPLIFLILQLVHVNYPSIICVIASTISLSALIIFHGNAMLEELKKRLHI